MRVNFFVSRFPCYSETFVINQINGLIERGFDVKITAIHKEDSDLDIDSITKHDLMGRCIFLLDEPINKYLKILMRMLWTLLGLYKKSVRDSLFAREGMNDHKRFFYPTICAKNNRAAFNADVIIAHFGDNAVTANNLKKLGLFKGQIFSVFHGYDISVNDVVTKNLPNYKILFKSGAQMLPISQLWRQKLLQLGCPDDIIHVNRMGVNPTNFSFKPREISKKLNILSVARHSEKKGLAFAIQAISILKRKGINVHYQIIGTGPLMSYHQKMIDELELNTHISILGYMNQTSIKEKLDLTDIFLLPSVTATNGDMEGVPVALMEAMAKGVLCISTLHSGIPELIEHDVSGFLAPERDSQSISDIIENIIKGKYAINQVQINARAKVMRDFNEVTAYDELSQLIKKKSQ